MRQLILETIDGETAGEGVVWLLLTSMWSRRRQSVARKNTVDHYAEALSTTMIKGHTDETVDS